MRVLYDYEGDISDGEMPFIKRGDFILLLDDSDESGWWLGRNERTGDEGIFPSNYCKSVKRRKM